MFIWNDFSFFIVHVPVEFTVVTWEDKILFD